MILVLLIMGIQYNTEKKNKKAFNEKDLFKL
jgi:hypothetical protein